MTANDGDAGRAARSTVTGGAIAKLLSLVETGGERARRGRCRAVPAHRQRVLGRHHRRAGRRQVDAHRPPHHGAARRRQRGRRARGRPDQPVQRWRDPRRPRAHAEPRDRSRRLHPLDGDTRGHLGGLALATPQAVRVLDAVGKPWIVVETVGVGQVEVEIAGAADTTVVVVNPGWGDGVQAEKAGLMEIADVFVVNKADRAGAADTEPDLRGDARTCPAHGAWTPPIVRDGRDDGRGHRRAVGRDRRVTAPISRRDGQSRVRRRDAPARRVARDRRCARLEPRAVDAVCSGTRVRRNARRRRDPNRAIRTLPPTTVLAESDRPKSEVAFMTDVLVATERHDSGVVLLRLQPAADEPAVDRAARRARATRRATRGRREREGRRGRRAARRRSPPAPTSTSSATRTPRARSRARSGAAFDAIAAIPRPVIAAIRGFALGGGLELALACDLRVAADTARLGQPEILLGIIPGAGGTQRLAALVGPARAKDLIWSGRQVRADEALAIGLVDRVVAPTEVEHAALHWAAELGEGRGRRHGTAPKRAIDDGLDDSFDRWPRPRARGVRRGLRDRRRAHRRAVVPRRRPGQGHLLGPLAVLALALAVGLLAIVAAFATRYLVRPPRWHEHGTSAAAACATTCRCAGVDVQPPSKRRSSPSSPTSAA